MAEKIHNPAALPARPRRFLNVDPGPRLQSGHYRPKGNYHVFRERCSSWLLFYTLKGEGFFRSGDGKSCLSKPGDLHLYPAHLQQEYGLPRGGNWDMHWVHFVPRPSWSAWLRWPEAAGPTGLLKDHVRHSTLRQRLERSFETLHQEARLGGSLGGELAMNALERILLLAGRSRGSVRERPLDPRVQAALERIAHEPFEKQTVSALAAAAGLSPSRFAHLFRADCGVSVVESVLQLRLKEACKMLELGGSTVSECAYACGFSSPYYFSRQFKKRYGKSPRAYRRRFLPS